MLITAIEPRRKGLVSLFIDGEEAMKLDQEVILSYRFDVGREITDEELREVIDASSLKRCKDKAMWLLSFRDHSRRELKDKLRKDFGEDAAEKAVERCEALGLLDDRRYAVRCSADLFHLKHLSKQGVKQKLMQKGIDKELIDEVLSQSQIDENAQIRKLIEKKYARSLSDEKGRRRAFSGLLRKGYSYSAVKDALRDYTDTEDDYE